MSVSDPRCVLDEAVSKGVFPGANGSRLGLSREPRSFFAGALEYGDSPAVGPSTLYDIASLTKVFTASAALSLVARGDIALNARVGEIFPPWRGAPVAMATLEQLLSHEAGLAPWAPFFEDVPPELRGKPGGREMILEAVLAFPLTGRPGAAEYSDLGYVLLGELLQQVYGAPLSRIISTLVTEPLDLASVRFFQPGTSDGNSASVAPTEDCPWRGRVLRGEVHDDNCWTMGGQEGHAGLFATAEDVARLGLAWLTSLEGAGWLPGDLARRAVARRASGRGIGWDMKSEAASTAGAAMSRSSFGHLGFTGCSLWVDPEAGVSISLLSNRVHPSRDNDLIRVLRPVYHDAVFLWDG